MFTSQRFLSIYDISLLCLIYQGSIPNPIQNKGGTSELLTIHFVIIAMSLVFLFLVRSRKTVSRIKEMHRNVTESSANGVTNFSLITAVGAFYLLVLVAIVSSRDLTNRIRYNLPFFVLSIIGIHLF